MARAPPAPEHVDPARDDGDHGQRVEPERAGVDGIGGADEQHSPIRVIGQLAPIGEPRRVRRLDEQRPAVNGLVTGPVVVDREVDGVDLAGAEAREHVPEEEAADDHGRRPDHTA